MMPPRRWSLTPVPARAAGGWTVRARRQYPPGVIPVQRFLRAVQGIPLTGGQGNTTISGAGTGTVSVGPQGLGNIWYPAQVAVQTTSGVNDGSTCQVFLGPAGVPVALLGTIFPGGFGVLAAAVPPIAPGQYLIAVWTGGNPGDTASINVIGTMNALMPA
jgi:hypothetical protein